MRKNAWFGLFILSLCVLSLAVIYGCGANPTGGGAGGSSGTTYYGTQSGGDVWKWVIDAKGTIEGSFTGNNLTTGMSVSGTYETLPSGFKKATVTSASGPLAPTPGTMAYFLEFPDTMLLVKPTTEVGGDTDKVIVCAAAASTAPLAGQYNWITIPWNGWTSNDQAYGTVEVTVTNGVYTFEVKTYALSDNPGTPTTEGGYTFSNGILSKAGSSLEVFMTPSGIYFGDSGPDRGGFAGASYEVDSGDVLLHSYRGVLFKYDPSGGSQHWTQAIGATKEVGHDWLIGGRFISDASAEPYYAPTESVTLEFSAQQPNGIIPATMTGIDFSCLPARMVVKKVNDKLVVFGIAADNAGNPQNFLVIQND
jgi:hypothetical protein